MNKKEEVYTEENYLAYCDWIKKEYSNSGIVPSSFEEWVAFNRAMDNNDPFDVGKQIVDNDRDTSN